MNLLKATGTIGGLTLVSRVAGFAREMLMSRVMGASWQADAFFVAFRLPNTFRRLFGEGAFSAGFVPLYSQRLHGESKLDTLVDWEYLMLVLQKLVGPAVTVRFLLFSLIGALGVTHDWNISRRIVQSVSTAVILAGGLGPDNVADAIAIVRPAGVDSKTKTDKDGSHAKDLERVRRFHQAARAADGYSPISPNSSLVPPI